MPIEPLAHHRRPARRSWLSALAFPFLGLVAGCATLDQEPDRPAVDTASTRTSADAATPRPFLQAAVGVAAGLEAQTVASAAGPVWADDAARPDRVSLSLGSGVGGKVVFFLALHRATGDDGYLQAARRGADYLLAHLPETVDVETFPPAGSLYYGIASVGLVLERAYRATDDERYRDGARRCLGLVEGLSREAEGEDGVLWHPSFNDLLFGNAGTSLYLLATLVDRDRAEDRALAVRGGRLLLDRAIAEQGGLTWKFRQDAEYVLPNFSHGAAGVGFVLARLYQATGEQDFLDGALGAARYLEAIADTAGGGFRVPYGWPEERWEGLYDVGWAHGPAGTARLFEILYRVTGDASWRDLVLACGRSVLSSGMPEDPAPGFGEEPHPLDRRFGVAGAADFLLDLYRLSSDPSYLELARRLAEHVLDRARAEGPDLVWETPADDDEPPARPTGLLSGAAGYGLLFLRLDAVERGGDLTLGLPDDPFAAPGLGETPHA